MAKRAFESKVGARGAVKALGVSSHKEAVVRFLDRAAGSHAGGGRRAAAEMFAAGPSVRLSDEAANRVVCAGLGAGVVDELATALPGIDKATLLRTIGIDKATLRRRERDDKPLDRAQTEAAVRTMELSALATETFGTLDRAAAWLGKPHPLLEGERPIERAANQYGAAQVKAILSAIRYGGVV